MERISLEDITVAVFEFFMDARFIDDAETTVVGKCVEKNGDLTVICSDVHVVINIFLLMRLMMTLTIVSFSSVRLSVIMRERGTRVLSVIRLEPSSL